MHFEKLRYKRFPATAKKQAKVQKVERRYNCKLSLQVGTAETKYLVRSKRYKKSSADTTAQVGTAETIAYLYGGEKRKR